MYNKTQYQYNYSHVYNDKHIQNVGLQNLHTYKCTPRVGLPFRRSTKMKKYKRNRRPKRGKFKTINKSVKLFNCNASGVKNRLQSLSNIINVHFPLIWTLQETHCNKPGQIKFEKVNEYQIYEVIRERKLGGGLAIGVHKSLRPVWVGQGVGEVEIMTVCISFQEMRIRITNCYGPQEYDSSEKKDKFWRYLEEEVLQCSQGGFGCIITMDANSWLGKDYIKEDPHEQNNNGKLFHEFLQRNPQLNLLNMSERCEGIITRSRSVQGKREESVIDFVITCDKVLPHFETMKIDEEKVDALTNFNSKKKGKLAKTSDHNSIFVNFHFKIRPEKVERRVVHVYKDEISLKQFKEMTTYTSKFSECFISNNPFEKQVKQWIKTLKSFINKVFRKVRITKRNPGKVIDKTSKDLFEKRKEAILKGNQKVQEDIEEVIKQKESEENMKRIEEHISEMKRDPNNKNNSIWKLKEKFFPKIQNPLPSAKYNNEGQLITNHDELKDLYLDHFKHRLRKRPIILELEEYKAETEEEFKDLLESSKLKKSEKWKMKDLERVLGGLKSKQSQDSNGIANEVFQLKNIGDDLKKSLLHMLNKIKESLTLPEVLRDATISAIPKNRKSPLMLENLRGIFLVNKVKAVLMKMINATMIDEIENNLTESNIGARKGRATRDHIFIINSIINETMKDKRKQPLDMVFYDVRQCFDSLWMEKTLIDLSKNGIKNDFLNLIYEASKSARIKVKTPVGNTVEKEIEELVMQGESVSSIMCTSSMDRMSKECKEPAYKYRDEVEVPKLGFVDDLIDVQTCGEKTKMMNKYTNDEINKRKLQFNGDKTNRMHVGKDKVCETIEIESWKEVVEKDDRKVQYIDRHDGKESIKTVTEQIYLGEVLSNDGKNLKNVEAKVGRGKGIVHEILILLNNIYFGSKHFEALKLMRESLLISVITSQSEVWINTTQKEMRMLESLDSMLLTRALNTRKNTSLCIMMLEMGIMPIRFHVMKKRVMYWFHLATEAKEKLPGKILEHQRKRTMKGDLHHQCVEDFQTLELEENEIEVMSKTAFKKLVNERVADAAFRYLVKIKNKQSKGKYLEYISLKMQPYLMAQSNLTPHQMCQIFQVRSKNLLLKSNFSSQFDNKDCVVEECGGEDSQEGLYSCEYLEPLNIVTREDIRYEDIYGNDVYKQQIVTQIIFQKYKSRQNYLNSRIERGKPGDREEEFPSWIQS